jgi:hypothetical protein
MQKSDRNSSRSCRCGAILLKGAGKYSGWRVVKMNTLVDHCGAQAWFVSGQRADALLSQGDRKDVALGWPFITVEELLRTTLGAGEHRQ